MGRLARSFFGALPPSFGGGRRLRPPPPLLALTAAVCVVLLVGVTRRSTSELPLLPRPPLQPASRLARASRGGAWPPPPPPSAEGWKGAPPLARKAKGWPRLAGGKGWPPLVGRRPGVRTVEAMRTDLWKGGSSPSPVAEAGGRGGESPVAAGAAPLSGHAPAVFVGATPPPASAAAAFGVQKPGGALRSTTAAGDRAADTPPSGVDSEASGDGANEVPTAKVLTEGGSRVADDDAADGASAVDGGGADEGEAVAPAVDGGDAGETAADAPPLGGPGPAVEAAPARKSDSAGVASGVPAVKGPEPQVAVAAAVGEDSRGLGTTVGAATAGSGAGGHHGSFGGAGTDRAVNLLAPVAAGTATAVAAPAPPPGPPITLAYCPEDWATGAIQSLAAALPGTLTAVPVAAVTAAAPGGGGAPSGTPDRPLTVFVRSAWGHCAAPAVAVGMVFVDMEPRAEPLAPPPGVVIVSGTDLWGGGASAAGRASAAAAGTSSPHVHIPYALVSLGQRVGVGAADLARPPGWVPPPPVVDGARFGVWDVEGCGPDARAAGGAAPPGDAAASVAFDVISSRYKRLAAVGGCHPPADDGRGEREAAVARLHGYKFALVAERSALPGFVSERVVDAYLAGVIPIYVGGPRDGGRYLNPGAVIRCGPGPAGDWAACLAAIAALDGDAAAHAAAVAAPLYAPGGGREGGWARWETHAARLVGAVRGLPGVAGGAPRGAPAAAAAAV